MNLVTVLYSAVGAGDADEHDEGHVLNGYDGPIDPFIPPRLLAALLTREPERVKRVEVMYSGDGSGQIRSLTVYFDGVLDERLRRNLAGLYRAYDVTPEDDFVK